MIFKGNERYAFTEDVPDFFDSEHCGVIFKGKTLIFPVMQLGISEHELNPAETLMHIEFSYLVFPEVLHYGDEADDIFWKPEKEHPKYNPQLDPCLVRYPVLYQGHQVYVYNIGGNQLKEIGNIPMIEMNLISELAYLYPAVGSRFASKPFFDINPLDYPATIVPEERIDRFFNGEFMPDSVRKILEE